MNISKTQKMLKKCKINNFNQFYFFRVSLVAFTKFKDTADALKSTAKLIKGKLPKKL